MKSENFLLVFALSLLAASVIFFFTNSNQPLFTASFATERVTQRFGECASCDVKGTAFDSVVSATSKTSNSGSATTLYFRYSENRVIMRFNLSGIPAGSTVRKATLRFFPANNYLPDNAAGKIGVKQAIYALTDPSGSGNWNESEVTFNNKKTTPSTVPWSSTGTGDITTALGSQMGFVYIKNWLSGGQGYYDADLTSAVQNWVNNPSSNLGLYIPVTNYMNKSFKSKEYSDEKYRPYLEVTFDGTNTESIPQPTGIIAKFWKGQTFLSWTEAQTDKNETSYRIYRYSQPITSSNINSAELVDEVYQGSSYASDSLYGNCSSCIKQVNISKTGITLQPNSGLYVYTVENPGNYYYAVTTVVEGNEKQAITAGQNSTSSSVSESIGIPDAFLFNHDSYNYYYSGYIMWLGSFNPKDTTDSYGFYNKHSVPVFFAVTLPYKTNWDSSNPENMAKFSSSRLGEYPLTLYLHASGKGYFQSEEGVDNSRYYDVNRYGGFDLAFMGNSRLPIKLADGSLADLGTFIETDDYGYDYYSGWNSNYTPANTRYGVLKSFKPTLPFEEGKSINYGEKQIKFIEEWMLYNSPWSQYMDPNRIYCTGGSLGASGCQFLAVHYPEMFAAVHAAQGRIAPDQANEWGIRIPVYWGPLSENIPMLSGTGIYDYFNLASYVSANPNKNYPPMRLNHGKNDVTIWWPPVPGFYTAASNARLPLTGYFDQSGHNGFEASYFPEAIDVRLFVKEQFKNSFDIFHYALNKSYPAFFDISINGNPGNGTAADGDLRGRINADAYFDRNNMIDSSSKYEVTVYLIPESASSSATATISSRRMQSFPHASGSTASWKNIASDGVTVLQSGTVTANAQGWYSIQNFQILKTKSKLQLLSGAPGDTTPPAIPSNFRSTGKDANSVALAWNANSESDLSAYKIYKNSSFLTSVLKPNTAFSANGLTANTTYSFQISAIDTSGNESAKSASILVTTNPQSQTCVLPQILCGASCITPACSSSMQCNDSNPNTTDTCNNAGTCTANCTHTPIGGGGLTYIVEPVEGIDIRYTDTNHVIFSTPSAAEQPAKCSYYIQPETGIKIWRITDVNDSLGMKKTDNDKNRGYFNGYSTYTNVNINGDYALAFGTGGNAETALYRISDCAYLGKVTFKNSTTSIGESQNPRWDLSGRPGTATTIYYHAWYGAQLLKQDVLLGSSSQQVIYNFSTDSSPLFAGVTGRYIWNVDHSDISANYIGLRLRGNNSSWQKVGVFDLVQGKLLSGIIDSGGEGDISPLGNWVNVGSLPYYNRFYKTSDLAQGITANYVTLPCTNWGHAGWAIDYNGDEVYVYQNNQNDWYEAFNPRTGTLTRTLKQPEHTGYGDVGQHISRIYNPQKKGWYSLGGTSHWYTNGQLWSANQILMIEIKPSVDAQGRLVPLKDRPRVWRIVTSPNDIQVGPKLDTQLPDGNWMEGVYWTEGFSNTDFSGNNIYVGGNWHGNDNLELYKIELPTNWQDTLNGLTPSQCYDLTGDHKVNVFDLTFVALRIGQSAGSPADVTGDGAVNILDLQAVARNFGQTC